MTNSRDPCDNDVVSAGEEDAEADEATSTHASPEILDVSRYRYGHFINKPAKIAAGSRRYFTRTPVNPDATPET